MNAFCTSRILLAVSFGLATACNHRESLNTARSQAASSPSGVTSSATTTSPDDAPSPALELTPGVAASDGGTGPHERATGTDTCHVLAIGDSLTDPRSNGGGYLKAWQAQCPHCRFTNIGHGGFMVNQMLSQLRKFLAEAGDHYSHWVVFGGVNDFV